MSETVFSVIGVSDWVGKQTRKKTFKYQRLCEITSFFFKVVALQWRENYLQLLVFPTVKTITVHREGVPASQIRYWWKGEGFILLVQCYVLLEVEILMYGHLLWVYSEATPLASGVCVSVLLLVGGFQPYL